MAKLYVGIVAPKTYSADVSSTTLNLTTVSAATFEIRKPDGTTTSWTGTISNQFSNSFTLTHTFAAGTSQVDQAGVWHFYIKMTIPGGYDRTETWVEDVFLEHG